MLMVAYITYTYDIGICLLLYVCQYRTLW